MKLIVDQFRQVLNLDTPQEAYQQVQFWDFELERQTAVPGQNPWESDWEAVNIADTIKLLNRLEFDLDIVEEKYRDVVFTMRLPYRVTGSWDQAAGPHGLLGSHPAIKEILTVRERLQTKARDLAILVAARKARIIEQKKKSGLASVQPDTRSLQNQMRDDPGMTDLFNQSLREVVERHFSDADRNVMGNVSLGYPAMGGRQQVVTIPEWLLFRFLDFSVVPGNAYRYRLRLKLQNPNFKRDPAELLDVSSREGRFRFTPWSDPSTPAVVQEETQLFVEKIDQRRGVSIDAYQWMTESGTYVNGQFEGLNRGEKIAAWTTEKKSRSGNTTVVGGVLTHVLRPVEETYLEERIDYVTPYSLIDFERTRVISPAEFPDLGLTSRRIPIVLDEVVTINRFGELNHLDSNRQAKDYRVWKGLMDRQKVVWDYLRPKDKAHSANSDLLRSGSDSM